MPEHIRRTAGGLVLLLFFLPLVSVAADRTTDPGPPAALRAEPSSPPDESMIFISKSGIPLTLHWKPSMAPTHRVVFGTTADLKRPVLDVTVDGASYRLESLVAGRYFWKVAPVVDGVTQAFSEVRRFTIVDRASRAAAGSPAIPQP